MADVSRLSRLINGIVRNVDLATNTLVVQNAKVNLGGANHFTFAGTLTGTRTVTVPDADVNLGHINSLNSLSGVAGGSTNLGAFAGITIPDDQTIKQALQSLETAVEAAGAGSEFSDADFRIQDNGDATKEMAFEVSAIATATTRTVAMPDADVDLGEVNTSIQQDGSRAFTADQSFGSFKATNLADPVAAQDAATKAYVDSLADGRSWKQSVKAASTADLTLSGAQTVDGVSLVALDRVLVKDQVDAEDNGIYVVAAGAWARSSDANAAAELIAAAVFVEQGTANGDKQFAQTADNITLGTTPLVWVVTSANHFSGHDMISLSGGQISVDLAAVSGLESSNPGNASGQLRVKVEAVDPSLEINGSNELAVKVAANAGLEVNGSGLAVVVDDVTIEIDPTDGLRVKDSSIDENKLSTAAVDGYTILGGDGDKLAVQHAPVLQRTFTAGEAFEADESFAVRFALNGEASGRVYKADTDASVDPAYMVVGIARTVAAIVSGDPIQVISLGTHVLGLNDTNFGAGDIGQVVYLGAAGVLTLTAPTADDTAVTQVGVVEQEDRVFVQPQFRGIN